jgi:hypothetical protein
VAVVGGPRPDEVETIVEGGSRTRSPADTDSIAASGTRPATASNRSLHATMATSVVMRTEEVTRARAFFGLTALMVLVAGAFMPLVPGPLLLRGLSVACCVFAAVLNLWAVRLLREEGRYTERFATLMGVVLGITSEVALFYFGMFTAAAMVLPLGVYFFGLSESRRAALATYLTGSIFWALLSAGVLAGVLPDQGPLPIGSLPWPWRWFFVVMTQVVFATTYFLARSSRRATEAAIARVERANRQIDQRDALLAEARNALDRALAPGEGRHTGAVVDGWTLGEVLGKGGMGEVYRVEKDGALGAMKLLHPVVLADPDLVQRFEREAELAARVSSPHVARILGTGRGPGGSPYLLMELVAGRDLAWHLRKEPRMRPAQVAELVDQAALALAACREAGVVHRDLKPQNLVRTDGAERVWKILDFGVARAQAGGATLTRGALVGTPSYMAPEQVRLGSVDHRTDLYALAAVAYRALVGKPAFAGDDVATVLYHVAHSAPVQPSATVRIPEDLDLVLAIGLAKDPNDRFQTAEEFARAFRAAVRSELDATVRQRGRALLAKQPWAKPAGAA